MFTYALLFQALKTEHLSKNAELAHLFSKLTDTLCDITVSDNDKAELDKQYLESLKTILGRQEIPKDLESIERAIIEYYVMVAYEFAGNWDSVGSWFNLPAPNENSFHALFKKVKEFPELMLGDDDASYEFKKKVKNLCRGIGSEEGEC